MPPRAAGSRPSEGCPRLFRQSLTAAAPLAQHFRALTLAGVIAGAGIAVSGCQSTAVKPGVEETVHVAPEVDAKAAEDETGPAAKHAMAQPLPSAAPEGRKRYTQVLVDGPYIALTFDDGPNRNLTPRLLDILQERNIPATFFVVGERVRGNATILRRMIDEGHEIGNHSWDHSRLDQMSPETLRSQLEWTNTVINAAIGKVPTLMRPPYGATHRELNREIFEDYGMTVIMWSVDSQDWKYRDANRVQQTILAGTRPGAIILSHDIQPSTISAMPETLDSLLAEGYTFVTVSELIAKEQLGE